MGDFWAFALAVGSVGLLVLLGVAATGLMFVKHNTCVVIERFGKFNNIKHAGLRFRIPFIDRVKKLSGLRCKTCPQPYEQNLKTTRCLLYTCPSPRDS